MYDWLIKSLAGDDSHVITANRRLARTLHDEYAKQRLAVGDAGWRRPVIVPASSWYTLLAERLKPRPDRPARLTPGHSRILWEQVLREDIDEPMLNIGSLARQCLDAWNRMHDWCVPLDECVAEAQGPDQRIFARAALRYQQRLDNEGWIDDAVFRATLPGWFAADGSQAPGKITLAGFDRISPRLRELLDQFASLGCEIVELPLPEPGEMQVRRYPNVEAELRAAGAWARRRLEDRPQTQLAIVVNLLEQRSEQAGHLLREGMIPGWQYGSDQYRETVNVSYGRQLSQYPAISIALLALRWLSQPMGGQEIGLLLRSTLLGAGSLSGRSRLELKLRDWPDRQWSRAMLLAALQPIAEQEGGADWLDVVKSIDDRLLDLPARQRPRAWAELFDEVLGILGWPGEQQLKSNDYQLDSRFRELLGEFARLELVQSTMTLSEATSRLSNLAAETLYQPEAGASKVDVLGPLEAAGQAFDAIWITGMTSADWPPPGRPSALLSRPLQRRYEMPDATPEDTVNQATRVLERLLGNSGESIVSYPAVIGDAEQLPTALIADTAAEHGSDDPGWHAEQLLESRKLVDCLDPVPAVGARESIAGGARTLDLETRDPIAAFAVGRLGVRLLRAFRSGIGPDVRGNLVHDALNRLYSALPTQAAISSWDNADRSGRARAAANAAFAPMFRHADETLKQLLRLEERRAVMLLKSVLEMDVARDTFEIAAVEQRLDARIGPLRLSLRADRVDRMADASLLILDYKTSRTQKFLTSGEPNDLQLPVYALAVDAPVSGLGLYRVDSAVIEIDGAGPALGGGDDWEDTLAAWQQKVLAAAVRFAEGDVRLNVRQANRDARPFSLLSRYAERIRDV